LREVSDDAVLAANYLKSRLAGVVDVPFSRPCMHEFVASSVSLKAETGIRTLDVAKRLIDYGFHPPTIYFPLTVEEALLIEPTETESLETLDAFVEAMARIVEEAHSSPDLLHSAPHYSPVRRLDETTAARQPNLRWRAMTGSQTPCPE
jgi:glycine dehydrogenase subunit 2